MLVQPAAGPGLPRAEPQQGTALLRFARHLLPAEAPPDQLDRWLGRELRLQPEGALGQEHQIHPALLCLSQGGRQALLQAHLLDPLELLAGRDGRLQHQHPFNVAAITGPRGCLGPQGKRQQGSRTQAMADQHRSGAGRDPARPVGPTAAAPQAPAQQQLDHRQ